MKDSEHQEWLENQKIRQEANLKHLHEILNGKDKDRKMASRAAAEAAVQESAVRDDARKKWSEAEDDDEFAG